MAFRAIRGKLEAGGPLDDDDEYFPAGGDEGVHRGSDHSGGASSASEYFRALVREVQKRKAKQAKAANPMPQRLTLAELHQEMMASGLITQLPNPAEDIDDDDPDDQPIAIEGEPLSETILRERR